MSLKPTYLFKIIAVKKGACHLAATLTEESVSYVYCYNPTIKDSILDVCNRKE
jgi:hypothetical protein